MKFRVVLVALAAVALAGCQHKAPASGDGAAGDPKKEAPPVAVTLASVSVKPMDVTVTEQGTLAPAQGSNARVTAVLAGRLTEVRVREGDRVTRGETLAMVDSRPQQAQARSAAAALTASEAQAKGSNMAVRAAATDQANTVHLATLTLAAARLDRANAVRQAQTALNAAETDLRKTKAGARPQEIAQADQAVTQATATRARAAIELDRVRFLNEKGIAPKRQLDDAQTALAVADSALESAQQQASLVRAGARTEDIRAAELRVQQAQEALSQAETTGKAKIDQAQAALRQAQQSVLNVDVRRQEAAAMQETANQKRADLSAAQAAANYAQLNAPLSGIVTRRALNPGDYADTTNPIVEITDTRSLDLIANLPAEDGRKVLPAMPARVTTTDAPNRIFAGRVLSVGQVDPQTNLLAVRVHVANPNGGLRIGAFATAEIVLRSNPRALVVPKQAVVNKEGQSVVFVVGADNVAHQKTVEVGPEQGDMVTIEKGLTPADRIVRLGSYELADGAKVKPADTEPAAEQGKDQKSTVAKGEPGAADSKDSAAAGKPAAKDEGAKGKKETPPAAVGGEKGPG